MLYRILFNPKTCVWNLELCNLTLVGIPLVWRKVRSGNKEDPKAPLSFETYEQAEKFVEDRGLRSAYKTQAQFASETSEPQQVYVLQAVTTPRTLVEKSVKAIR